MVRSIGWLSSEAPYDLETIKAGDATV